MNRSASLWSKRCRASALVLLFCAGCWLGAAAQNSEKEPTTVNVEDNSARQFVVFGKVTDGSGAPLSGVTVTAHCGMGTLLPTGTATTAADGSYRLAFGPGLHTRISDTAPFGVGFQVATVSARKPGFSERELGRRGNLAMSDSSQPGPTWATNFSAIVRPKEPYRLDFTLEPAGRVTVKVSDPEHRLPAKASLCLTGDKLPPSSSVLACSELGKDGRCEFVDVPVGHSWRFETTWRKGDGWKTIRSPNWTQDTPQPKVLELLVTESGLEIVK